MIYQPKKKISLMSNQNLITDSFLLILQNLEKKSKDTSRLQHKEENC